MLKHVSDILLKAKFLNLKLCTVYSFIGASTITGPTETTTFGSSLFWSTALMSLPTNRHTNVVRFKWTLLMNSASHEWISYFFWSMMDHSYVQVQRCTQLYCSECTPEQGKQCWQGNTEIFWSSSLLSVDLFVTCSLMGVSELGSTKVNILKMKRL